MFSRLTTICRVDNKHDKEAKWLCVCKCGNVTTVTSSHLVSGHTKSCGCIHTDSVTKHGLYKSRLYYVWGAMRDRCNNTNNPYYYAYGERGISVCREWNDFGLFAKWAYENGYLENAKKGECTLDRIDVNADYKPQNCRWIDMKAQCKNKRNTVFISYNGDRKTINEWSKTLGINRNTIAARYRRNLPPEKILYDGVLK